ncbi:MAG TPA: helix-turn-helix transcriptional regulator [Candidatus Limnocylindrales bacterium]|nr:helix-turn-helix transcriptional regulator [Candidatus Limnocylindrales bacterium]
MRTRRTSPAAAVITAVPEADRTRAFVGELRTLVRATYVVFARYDQNGIQNEIVLAEDHGNPSRQTEWLQAERLLQSRSEASIPRVTDAMIALDGMRGLVAVYGVDRTIFGLAIVARPRAFLPEERKALEATLRSGSELMRRLSTFEGEQSAQERTAERANAAQFVLSRDFAVESRWIPDDDPNDVLQNILELAGESLPPVVEKAVRDVTASWTDDPGTWQPDTVVPLPFMVVRVAPLTGPAGPKIGVLVERYRSRNPLRHAADKFGMSSRELEVLALVLKGFGTPQIATALDIAESTAHDHIKRMMLKTRARNRVELAAKALGWRGA